MPLVFLSFIRGKVLQEPRHDWWLKKFTRAWYEPVFRHLLRKILRPREYRLYSSAGAFAAGIAVSYLFFAVPIVVIGVLILAEGDPRARKEGIERGGPKMPYHDQKTRAGFKGFMFGAARILLISDMLTWFFPLYNNYSMGKVLCMQAVAVFVGALAEVYSGKVKLNDNFAIAIAASAAAWAVSLIPIP